MNTNTTTTTTNTTTNTTPAFLLAAGTIVVDASGAPWRVKRVEVTEDGDVRAYYCPTEWVLFYNNQAVEVMAEWEAALLGPFPTLEPLEG